MGQKWLLRAAVGVLAGTVAIAGSVALPAPLAAAEVGEWQMSTQSEVRYFSWEGMRGYPAALNPGPGSGWQLYTPMAVQIVGVPAPNLKFALVGRGGYVESKQTTPGATGSVSTFTDTVLAGTWTYYGIRGIQPFFSFGANLPTGQSVLAGTDTFARMDPDLAGLATFGEGWNYGPTVGFNLPFTKNLIVSVSAGHTFRGAYDREAVTGPPGIVRVDPGDVTSVNAAMGFKRGALTGRLSAGYSHEGETSYNGVPGFQLGDRFFVSSSSSYAWSKSSVSTVIASWNYLQKNKMLNPPPMFLTEAFNSNSNVYRVSLQHLFTAGQWAAGPTVSYLFRDHNAYTPAALQFVAAKTRWGAGGQIRYQANDKTLLYLRGEYIWVNEGARPAAAPAPVPALSYTGWSVSGGGTFRY